MITKEIQRAGIPVVQVTNLTKIAEGIGANRILRGNSVLHVFGDPSLPLSSEQNFREEKVKQALDLLEKTPAEGKTAIVEE
ncbi:hypothetical protein [Pyramidobacter sp.]|uniref:hypothetical protein n=1 Tax=Pyramidobacter sp. TaxID=1943581 RepID=UPI0025DB10AE|nr:hypothetical protein [Pyramidobacter sp.]MCI7403392.1 hypothetical protein [Pyramidobacter sp.]MDY3211473.1 hypothetical protein [Pyramidobacter sp.]